MRWIIRIRNGNSNVRIFWSPDSGAILPTLTVANHGIFPKKILANSPSLREKQLFRKFCVTVLQTLCILQRHVRHYYSQVWSKSVITLPAHCFAAPSSMFLVHFTLSTIYNFQISLNKVQTDCISSACDSQDQGVSFFRVMHQKSNFRVFFCFSPIEFNTFFFLLISSKK